MNNKIKVIIANDNEVYGEELKKELEQTKEIEVISVVNTGKNAFNDIIKYQPDIVITDVILSDGSGIKLKEDVEECRLAHKIKFIIVSSISQKNIISKAKTSGINDYFVKPFEIDKLLNVILDRSLNESVFEKKKINFVEVEDKTNEKNLEPLISNLLHDLGLYSNLIGYDLIKESVIRTIDDSSYVKMITKKLYPALALETKASPQAVERAIRSCIEIAWDRGDVRTLEQLFGRECIRNRRPTNSQFIAVIAEKIRLDIQVEENKQLV